MVLVCQRTRHQTMPLKWEFPGGKIEEGEQPRDALRRELDEELGIDARIGEEVARIRHEYKSGGAVELRFYVVQDFKGKLENRIFRDVRWAKRSELPSYDFLEADLGLVKDLAKGKIVEAVVPTQEGLLLRLFSVGRSLSSSPDFPLPSSGLEPPRRRSVGRPLSVPLLIL